MFVVQILDPFILPGQGHRSPVVFHVNVKMMVLIGGSFYLRFQITQSWQVGSNAEARIDLENEWRLCAHFPLILIIRH